MSSERAKPRAIATQLVVLFTLSAALLLSCGLGVFYWMVVRHAFEEDNAVLNDKLVAIESALKQPDGINMLDGELKSRRTGEPAVYWVRILAPDGTVLTETPGMNQRVPHDVFATLLPSTTESRKDYHHDGRVFSLVAKSENLNGQDFTIEIAQDRSEDECFRKQFGALLGLVLAAGLLASAAIAVTVTRRGLRPLGQMRRLLERVQPGHFNERIESAHWPSELRPLAASFDDMLARLEDSFTRLSQFSADLAHELRTPIGNMLGEAQVALTRDRSEKEYRSVIESSAAECERLSGIIENLLFLARAESAEQKIERKQFDARTALEKIAAFYQPSAEDRQIALSCEGDAEISADPMLFNRAIGNLIQNALRFTPDGGTIRISAANLNGRAEISVADNGSGIAPEHLPRVFDRFYRADPSRSSAGTGLGLSLVRSIVDLHGGTATIQSEAGRGTTVTLIFPRAEPSGW